MVSIYQLNNEKGQIYNTKRCYKVRLHFTFQNYILMFWMGGFSSWGFSAWLSSARYAGNFNNPMIWKFWVNSRTESNVWKEMFNFEKKNVNLSEKKNVLHHVNASKYLSFINHKTVISVTNSCTKPRWRCNIPHSMFTVYQSLQSDEACSSHWLQLAAEVYSATTATDRRTSL